MLVAQLRPTLCDPMDCSPPGFSVHGLPRPEYWSGLSFPSPEDLPNPGIKPRSPTLQADSLSSETPGKPNVKTATEAADDEEGTYLSIAESNVLTHLS